MLEPWPTERKVKRTLILQGSARVDGNTGAAAARLALAVKPAAHVLHLCSLDIRSFKYEGGRLDDFDIVVDQMLRHEQIVFATPVYWYAMSGVMKTLFDRLTGLLLDPDQRKLGRALAGRSAWLLATGTDDELPPGFTEPFSRTCGYFGMVWSGAAYVRVAKEITPAEQDLAPVDQWAVNIFID